MHVFIDFLDYPTVILQVAEPADTMTALFFYPMVIPHPAGVRGQEVANPKAGQIIPLHRAPRRIAIPPLKLKLECNVMQCNAMQCNAMQCKINEMWCIVV